MDGVGKFFSLLVDDYLNKDVGITWGLTGLLSKIDRSALRNILNKFTLQEYKEFMPILMNKLPFHRYVHLDMNIPQCLSIMSYNGQGYENSDGTVCSNITKEDRPLATWTDYDSYLNTVRILCNDGKYYPNPKYTC